ncbi:MAG: protein-L-isoaspartate(D-aspartate) O-methyltransferase [Actinomycetota bacterium]|jgi:protein-L-isoaspartate(D-aspartate) O-methyltransferase|nr:protein-L-isoaspartate(D-aspartate) O-methyltransferase [Actinomycetota bacterium]
MPANNEELVSLIAGQGTKDPRVLDALRQTDRAAFVPEGRELEAYFDRPVLLPERQTTSQPSLIARMIEAAAVRAQDTVLEIGTGYGYQTALLARLAGRVTSLERFGNLAAAARNNLTGAGIDNVEVIVGDGWEGWPDAAPFDAIVVSAAASKVPAALAEQLAEGGRLVIPVKRRGSDDVFLFKKVEGELMQVELLTPARFVPLVPGPVPGPTE